MMATIEYIAGQQYAKEIILGIRDDAELLPALDRLEKNAKHQPEQYAAGVRSMIAQTLNAMQALKSKRK